MSVYYSTNTETNVCPALFDKDRPFPDDDERLRDFLELFLPWYHHMWGWEQQWPLTFWFFRENIGDGSPADLEVEVDRETRPAFQTLRTSWVNKQETKDGDDESGEAET